jgi:hypothetical protein
MNNESTGAVTKAGKRFFKLINNEVVFGECETLVVDGGHVEILIKKPYTAKGGNIMPYMVDVMTSSPGAIQIHPMNILWTVPLDEFPEAHKVYIEATTGIDLSTRL